MISKCPKCGFDLSRPAPPSAPPVPPPPSAPEKEDKRFAVMIDILHKMASEELQKIIIPGEQGETFKTILIKNGMTEESFFETLFQDISERPGLYSQELGFFLAGRSYDMGFEEECIRILRETGPRPNLDLSKAPRPTGNAPKLPSEE